MPDALYHKDLGGKLVPADSAAAAIVRNVPVGGHVWAKVRKARNPRRHRLFWALVQIIKDNTDLTQSPEAIAAYLKLRGGHVEVFRRDGKTVEVPASIAFSKCTEDEFGAFLDRLFDVIRADFIPGLDPGELRQELEAITGLKVEQ